MSERLLSIARWFWPTLDEMTEQRRLMGVCDVITFLILLPVSIAGLVWLVLETDIPLIREELPILLIFGALIVLFNRLRYFFIFEIRTDRFGSAEGSLASMIQWSAAFLFGPSALWLSILTTLGSFGWNWRKPHSEAAGWAQLRNLVLEISSQSVAYLVALDVYRRAGGVIPIPGISMDVMAPALIALGVHFLVELLCWLPYILHSIWVHIILTQTTAIAHLLKFLLLALGLPVLAHPFAILVAGLYVEDGILIDLFFIFGLLMVAYLGRQLSWAAETSRQQSRQLEQLEALGRAIINAPPDASTLAAILEEHLPMMFPSSRTIIWMTDEGAIYKNPGEWHPDIESIWEWVREQDEIHGFLANNDLPWRSTTARHDPTLLAPIQGIGDEPPQGCIYIELRSLAQPWDLHALQALYPAVQSLADLLASTLRQAAAYAETLEYQSALQELEFAGRIQASFLPNDLPDLDRWELAVTLLPARETSGDFFDFIPASDGKVGILVADVADKGLGAALYMALSRTLIRTYAVEYEASPDIVFFSANERILQDARANLFVTVFYGLLDPATGELTYCNAGHSSPLLLSRRDGGTIHALSPTGMPIGIDEDATWTQATIQIEPGDVLLLYTDGIPDAQNEDGVFFKERRLIEVAQLNMDGSAQDIQLAILDAVQEFSGATAQFDDITLLVLRRDPNPPDVPGQQGDLSSTDL
jgi:serine phosphatase RsbU (regulator of sigma subunit)